MTRQPSTDDQLRALADQRATAQAMLARAVTELDRCVITSRRRDDALTLLARLLLEVDGMSAEIDQLLELRSVERDPDRMM